jgi:hypothetical protein
MTLIVDLREAAAVIEADFSHLWIPQDTRCWYRPGAFEPIINPAVGETYFIRIGEKFIPIKEFSELPDADIFNYKGLVIPRELVSTLSNKCSHPTRGLYLVQQYLSEIICNQLAVKHYHVGGTRDWYVGKYLNPQLLDVRTIPNPEDEKPEDILWNALSEHWFKLTEYLQELASLVVKYIAVNRYCEYHEAYRHCDLILDRGEDTRILFFEKYSYLEEEIQKLHQKAQEEKEITKLD